jgi:hypothetical protein
MRKTLMFLLLQALIISGLHAQEKNQLFRVLFETGSYTLTPEGKQVLDDVITAAKANTYYEIDLSGHTDYEGSASYNQTLSENRANAVKAYLATAGIDAKNITETWYGERKPVATNATDNGKQLNRRVEVKLCIYQFKTVDELLNQANNSSLSVLKLSGDGAQTIAGVKGTQISIPADAFVLPDGTPVKNSDVQITMGEFNSFSDAIFNKLSTQSNGQMLESGGMMKITATYNGQELKLKDAQSLQVAMPSMNIQPGMTVFTGVKNAQGNIDWVDTKSDFGINGSEKKKIPLVMEGDKLRTLKVNVPDATGVFSAVELNVPQMPKLPKKPKAPFLPKRQDYHYVLSGFQNLIHGRKYKERIADQKYAKAKAAYDIEYAKFGKQMTSYNHALELHAAEIAAFGKAEKIFRAKADSLYTVCRDALDEYKQHYDALRWNNAIEQLAQLNEKKQILNIDVYDWLSRKANEIFDGQMALQVHTLENTALFYKELSQDSMPEITSYFSRKGVADYTAWASSRIKKGNYIDGYWLQNYTYANAVANAGTANNTLRKLVADATMKQAQTAADAGMLSKSALNNVYTASIGTVGYINCDRFIEVPPAQMVKVEIKNPTHCRVIVRVDKLNSILYPDITEGGDMQVNLPKGEKITVVAINVDQGKPVFEKQQLVVSKKNNQLAVNPKPVLLKDLSSELASL